MMKAIILSMSLSLAGALFIFFRRFLQVAALSEGELIGRLKEEGGIFEDFAEKTLNPFFGYIKRTLSEFFNSILMVMVHKIRVWVGLLYAKLAWLDVNMQRKGAARSNSYFWREINGFKKKLKKEGEIS